MHLRSALNIFFLGKKTFPLMLYFRYDGTLIISSQLIRLGTLSLSRYACTCGFFLSSLIHFWLSANFADNEQAYKNTKEIFYQAKKVFITRYMSERHTQNCMHFLLVPDDFFFQKKIIYRFYFFASLLLHFVCRLPKNMSRKLMSDAQHKR